MTKSLSEQLEAFLKSDWRWHVKGELLRMDWRHEDGRTYMPTTVARTLNLMESGEQKIAVQPCRESNTVEYKFLPLEYRKVYIPYSARPDDSKEKMWSGELPKRFKIVSDDKGAREVEKGSYEL